MGQSWENCLICVCHLGIAWRTEPSANVLIGLSRYLPNQVLVHTTYYILHTTYSTAADIHIPDCLKSVLRAKDSYLLSFANSTPVELQLVNSARRPSKHLQGYKLLRLEAMSYETTAECLVTKKVTHIPT